MSTAHAPKIGTIMVATGIRCPHGVPKCLVTAHGRILIIILYLNMSLTRPCFY